MLLAENPTTLHQVVFVRMGKTSLSQRCFEVGDSVECVATGVGAVDQGRVSVKASISLLRRVCTRCSLRDQYVQHLCFFDAMSQNLRAVGESM